MKKYNMDQFFNWLAKPMNYEEIDAWYKANNIIPELSDLFRDFCFSLLNLVQDTYLGDTSNDNKETNIGLTLEDNESHFIWTTCLDLTSCLIPMSVIYGMPGRNFRFHSSDVNSNIKCI